jgi:serine protease Do
VRGALIGDVTPNSPAQKAGLEKGDIILDINGTPVNGSAELRMHVSLMAPGTKVNVKVFRDGAEKTLPLILVEMPTETARNEQPENSSEDALQGITVESVTARTARQLGLPANATGVVVSNVDPASKAADSGLKRGSRTVYTWACPVERIVFQGPGGNRLCVVCSQWRWPSPQSPLSPRMWFS